MKDSDFTTRKIEFDAVKAEREERDFHDFISSPVNKLALTMLPQSEPQELTMTVLRAAFKAGMECGVGCCSADLINLLSKALKEKKP